MDNAYCNESCRTEYGTDVIVLALNITLVFGARHGTEYGIISEPLHSFQSKLKFLNRCASR